MENLNVRSRTYTTATVRKRLRREATVRASQRINALKGMAIGVEIRHVRPGASVESEQIIDVVENEAEAIGAKVDTVDGSVNSRQEIKEVKGKTTGLSIDKLG